MGNAEDRSYAGTSFAARDPGSVTRRGNGWANPEELQAAAERSTAEGERRPEDIAWIRSYVLAEADGSLGSICIYQASSPEAVREHAEAAGMPADEVVPVSDTVIVREDPAPDSA
jgi:hypothetical protein